MNIANDPKKAEEYQSAVIKGGLKGGLGGLGPSLKAFGVILVAVPAFVISAERGGLAYERTQWHDAGQAEIETVQARERARWESMSTKDKIANFAIHHQYSIIAGSWVASMLGAYAWVARDPLATPLQKITQTRVYAQGITLGIILSAAVLTHGRTSKHHVDHSWRDILDREEEEKKQTRKT